MSFERQLHINIRGRNGLNLANNNNVHSPDGHFDVPDELARQWQQFRSFSLADVSIRRRSKDKIDCMQGVEEEDAIDSLHQWLPPKKTDSRSPCPALNTAANHNYLPRNGRNLTIRTIATGIKECYNISWGLAFMLTVGGFIMLRLNGIGRGWINPMIDLEELAAHNVLEHNASLTRLDFDEVDPKSLSSRVHHGPARSRSVSSSSSTAVASTPHHPSSHLSFFLSFFSFLYPSTLISIAFSIISRILAYISHSTSFPVFESLSSASSPPSPPNKYHSAYIEPNRPLIRSLLADSASGTHFTIKDIARARIRRMDNCPNPKVSRILTQFADAELCLSLAVLSSGKELKVDLETLREWLEKERLPRNYKPRRIGVWENHQNTAKMQEMIRAMRQYKAKDNLIKTVVFE